MNLSTFDINESELLASRNSVMTLKEDDIGI